MVLRLDANYAALKKELMGVGGRFPTLNRCVRRSWNDVCSGISCRSQVSRGDF